MSTILLSVDSLLNLFLKCNFFLQFFPYFSIKFIIYLLKYYSGLDPNIQKKGFVKKKNQTNRKRSSSCPNIVQHYQIIQQSGWGEVVSNTQNSVHGSVPIMIVWSSLNRLLLYTGECLSVCLSVYKEHNYICMAWACCNTHDTGSHYSN